MNLKVMFVGATLTSHAFLLLSFLHFTTTYLALTAVERKGGRKSRDGSFRNNRQSVHTDQEREQKNRKKKIPSHILTQTVPPTGGLTTSQKTDASLC